MPDSAEDGYERMKTRQAGSRSKPQILEVQAQLRAMLSHALWRQAPRQQRLLEQIVHAR